MLAFSVCTSVYINDRTDWVLQSINSLLQNTISPDEIVIVVDGPIVKDLDESLTLLTNRYPFIKLIKLEKNVGLGNAMRIAVENASYELIARMDSDDIASKDRFEKQLKCFERDNQLSIAGGAIIEFVDNPNNPITKRICPITDSQIKNYMKSRCGFNHMTVMFKKMEVIKSGNYQHWHYNEDYFLWLRMMLVGCRFANLPDVLVNVRVGKEMYSRRGGWSYFKSEIGIQKFMLKNKIISFPHYLYNVGLRFTVEVIIPNSVRGCVFRTFARSK